MASDVDICNMALAFIGDVANITSLSPPEGSAEAEHCAMFYPMARDTLLQSPPAWNFATRRVLLAPLAVRNSWTWKYAYAVPADFLVALAVMKSNAGRDDETEPYIVENEDGALVIRTDVPNAALRYTARIEDAGKFPPLFVEGLAWLLASKLAGPIVKGDTGAKMAQQLAQQYLIWKQQAASVDANQGNFQPVHHVGWLEDR
jgi:hypothetical protein